MKSYILSLSVILLLGGCASKNDEELEKSLLSAQRVEVYNITPKKLEGDAITGRALLNDFPFISNQRVVGYKGKFSNEFYNQLNSEYHFASLRDVDIWKLKSNPSAENFIYVLPMWVKQFKKVSNDLFEDIGFSNNLSLEEQKILKGWISEGGVLWIDGGIYSTRYDTFKKDGIIDSQAMKNMMDSKSSQLSFFGKTVNIYKSESKAIDFINFEPLQITYKTKSKIPFFQDIKTLQITTDNYLNADFMPQGDHLLESENGTPLVTFVKYGKGGVVFLRSFDFEDKMYDGELLRWKLLDYFMKKVDKKKELKADKMVQTPFKSKNETGVVVVPITLENKNSGQISDYNTTTSIKK